MSTIDDWMAFTDKLAYGCSITFDRQQLTLGR